MNGKIVLVTGATGSIGVPLCKEIAKKNATLVLLARDEKKLQSLVAEIKTATGNQNVEYLVCDMGSLADIRKAAGAFSAKYPKLDVLINNAAIYSGTRKTTADGLESMFGVDYLAPFLLTNLLLDKLKASAPSRIVNMTMAAKQPMNFDDLMMEKSKWDAFKQFNMAKTACDIFTVELATKLQGTNVAVISCNPGMTKSTLPREASAGLRFVFKLAGQRPEKGAGWALVAASAPEYQNSSGKLFIKGKESKFPEIMSDAAMRTRLWNESSRLTGTGQ